MAAPHRQTDRHYIDIILLPLFITVFPWGGGGVVSGKIAAA